MPVHDDAHLGYPRLVQRADGCPATVYYWAIRDLPQQHTAATIGEPGETGLGRDALTLRGTRANKATFVVFKGLALCYHVPKQRVRTALAQGQCLGATSSVLAATADRTG